MTAPHSLTAFQFDSPLRANEFVAVAVRMESEGQLIVQDAVFVTKDPDGTAFVSETTDLTTGQGAWSGAAWGGLLGLLLAVPIAGLVVGAGVGALRARSSDIGVSNEFVDKMRQAVEPGKTVLVLLTSHVDERAVLTELERFPGVELLASDLAADAVALVNDATAQAAS